ncbi:MAG: T9SS type A sorting domain-containing protein [Flavobacteriaceae bacterium]|nr:T9SS type A sorting domain-containing protein [Flavobacteriaceae bacterium]
MKQKSLYNLFLIFLCFGTTAMLGQSNVTPTGGEGTGSGGSLSYSVGQIDYIEASGSGGTANLGLQQPYEIFVLGTDDYPNISVEITAYPNPTISNVNIRLDSSQFENLNYQLFDINGRLLSKERISDHTTEVTMDELSSAVYLLHVFDNYSLLKSFKIIKK